MSMSSLFQELSAPLNNHMWSWGAVREQDRTVFLRVWEDEARKMPTLSGAYFIGVGRTEPTDTSLGANERRAHIALIKSGYRVFFIMCEAQDNDAVTMSVKAFDDRDLRLGGRVVEQDGIVWIELLARVPVRAARLNQ